MQLCRRIVPGFSLILLVLAGCSSDRRHAVAVTDPSVTPAQRAASPGHDDEIVSPVLQQLNDQLAARGLGVQLVKVELLGSFNIEHKGITIIDNDRHKQLNSHFVPGDTRRNADGNNITYLVDQSDATPNGGLTSAQAEAAIDRAMATWNSVECAKIPIVKRADSGADPDLIDGLLGFGTVGTPFSADIVQAGWISPAFFDAFLPGAGNYILGGTFTFILFDAASGNDINRDGKFDVAWREIYYNNHFAWGIDADPPVADVETVALHESGHGLSQDHFGLIFQKNEPGDPNTMPDGDGDIQFAPFAVMNATIFGQNHVLQGSDIGGHCGIWGNWPNK